MTLAKTHEFELRIPGLPELLPLARTFLEEVMQFASFDREHRERLLESAMEIMQLVERELEARTDVDLPIELRARVDINAMQLRILEHGVPITDGCKIASAVANLALFDEVYWEQLGAAGSALHLVAQRPSTPITAIEAIEERLDAESMVEHETRGELSSGKSTYNIRRFESADALEVSRQIYSSYGRSYPNQALFCPERVIALNDSAHLHSIVAEAPDGTIVGHYAIERSPEEPIGEAGIAVVDPDHRGHGLLGQMRSVLVQEARGLGLRGLWSQPTARHPYSQRMNIRFGSTMTGLTLGTTPASTVLCGEADSDADAERSAPRHSCFLAWYPLQEESAIEVSVPDALASVVQQIQAARARPTTISSELIPPHAATHRDGITAMHTNFNTQRAIGKVQVHDIVRASVELICEAVKMLESIAGAEAVAIDLPIVDPSCAWLAEMLMAQGSYRFAGIGPYFLGEDALRLQHLATPIDQSTIVIEGDLAKAIATAVFSD